MTLAQRIWRAVRARLRPPSDRPARVPIPPDCWPLH